MNGRIFYIVIVAFWGISSKSQGINDRNRLLIPTSIQLSYERNINTQIQLSWQANTEDGIISYIIEESRDGKNFTTIDEVVASEKIKYQYLSNNNFKRVSTHYYRIIAVENNWKFSYSNTIEIANDCNTKTERMRIGK